MWYLYSSCYYDEYARLGFVLPSPNVNIRAIDNITSRVMNDDGMMGPPLGSAAMAIFGSVHPRYKSRDPSHSWVQLASHRLQRRSAVIICLDHKERLLFPNHVK